MDISLQKQFYVILDWKGIKKILQPIYISTAIYIKSTKDY